MSKFSYALMVWLLLATPALAQSSQSKGQRQPGESAYSNADQSGKVGGQQGDPYADQREEATRVPNRGAPIGDRTIIEDSGPKVGCPPYCAPK
jgi:hypothetical protein